jgi:Tol biopolymer transport system component
MHKITNFTDGRLTDHEWSPDRQRVAVVRRDDAGENVWVVDVKSGSAKQITHFDNQEVAEMQWALDSQRVAVRAGTTSRDVVMMSNFK